MCLKQSTEGYYLCVFLYTRLRGSNLKGEMMFHVNHETSLNSLVKTFEAPGCMLVFGVHSILYYINIIRLYNVLLIYTHEPTN